MSLLDIVDLGIGAFGAEQSGRQSVDARAAGHGRLRSGVGAFTP
jgi:hypothetical protein